MGDDDMMQRAAFGTTVKEYDDLQLWIRHGRIGTGRTYAQEVERAREIEAAKATGAQP